MLLKLLYYLMWEIDRTEELTEWVKSLDDDAHEAIFKNLIILKEIGPVLGRPFVDTIKKVGIRI